MCAYLQILPFSEQACFVIVFHFMSWNSPELARWGMTEQLWRSVVVKKKARSMREVDPLPGIRGDVCKMVLPVPVKMSR